jgi:hypothetical protein
MCAEIDPEAQMNDFRKLMRFYDRRHGHLLFMERLRRQGRFEWCKRANNRYVAVYMGRSRRR